MLALLHVDASEPDRVLCSVELSACCGLSNEVASIARQIYTKLHLVVGAKSADVQAWIVFFLLDSPRGRRNSCMRRLFWQEAGTGRKGAGPSSFSLRPRPPQVPLHSFNTYISIHVSSIVILRLAGFVLGVCTATSSICSPRMTKPRSAPSTLDIHFLPED